MTYTNAHFAAALLWQFRIPDLIEFGSSTDDVEDVLGDSTPLAGTDAHGLWRLVPSIRADVLRRLSRESRLSRVIEDVYSKITGAKTDPLCSSFSEISRYGSSALHDMTIEDLGVIAPVLESVGSLPGFPDRQEIERRLGLLRLLEPFERLVGTHFRGRADELKQLDEYVGVLEQSRLEGFLGGFFASAEKLPFLVYGVGGVGKSTLIAKFILDHAKAAGEQGFPFAYLDYDRRAVMIDEPASILIEAVRQIGLQRPEAGASAISLRQSWRDLLAAALQANDGGVRLADDRRRIRSEFAGFIRTLQIGEDMPVLLVLDTFEEVQSRSRAYVEGLNTFLTELRREIPRLRIVLSGRAKVEKPALAVLEPPLELKEFDPDAAAGFLEANGISDPAVAGAIVKRVTGNPLSLRLAIALFRVEGLEGITSLGKTITQGQLFKRILKHVHNDDVREIAHPGLVLRRVSADIIREVLAGPCNIKVPDKATAERLFAELEKEVALVSPAEATGVVVHRDDVRKLMLQSLRDDKPDQVRAIHENAIRYYSRFADPVSRAEEIYHRLSLRQPPEEVTPLFMPGLTQYLTNALDELEPPERAFLADQLKIEIPPEARAAATDEVWERTAERRLDEYLRLREYAPALRLLAERKNRSWRTMVRVREATVLLRTGRVDEAAKVAADAIEVYSLEGNLRALFETRIVASEIAQRRNAWDEATAHLDSAEKLADEDPDKIRLAGVLAERCILREARAQPQDEELLKRLAAVAAEPPDAAWTREPALLRLITVFAAGQDRTLIEKALRLAPPSRIAPDQQRAIEQVLRLQNIDAGASLADAVLRALPSQSPLSPLYALVLRWLRSETKLNVAVDDSEARRSKKKSSLKRDDVGPLLAALHLTRQEIASILEHRLKLNLDAISFSQDDDGSLSELLDVAASAGWLPEFVDAVRLTHRDAAFLSALDALGMGVSVSDSGTLAKDVVVEFLKSWRPLVAMFEHSICRIEDGTKLSGTGFLVDDDRVLTTRGTVPSNIENAQVRFDYGAIGSVPYHPGTTARIRGPIMQGEAKSDALFLTLQRAVGQELVGGDRTVSTAFRRNKLDIGRASAVAAGDPLLWMWHSSTKIELAGAAVESVTDDEIVIDAKGRSEHAGAPCFDRAFGLVGIHCGVHPARKGKALILRMTKVEAIPDPFAVTFIGDRPFIDRMPLRAALKSLIYGGQRILIVNGEPDSGKTYTTYLIRHLAEWFGFQVILMDLSGRSSYLTPFTLGQNIAARMGLSGYPALGEEQSTRWIRSYFDWLTGVMTRRPPAAPWWIVVDGFDAAAAPQETLDFIEALAVRIEDMPLRLVLLGYDRELPPQVEPLVVREQTTPFTNEDLTEFFVRFYREQRPDMNSREVVASTAAAVEAIMSLVAETPSASMMTEAVVQVCEQIVTGGDSASSPSAPG